MPVFGLDHTNGGAVQGRKFADRERDLVFVARDRSARRILAVVLTIYCGYLGSVRSLRIDRTTDGQSHPFPRPTIKDAHAGKDLFASAIAASTPVAPGDGGASAAVNADLATLREIGLRDSRRAAV